MSQESQQFTDSVAAAVAQGGEAIALLATYQTQLVAANEATAAAILAGATDKEIADAARTAQPVIDGLVTALDAATPSTTPVTPTMRAKFGKKR